MRDNSIRISDLDETENLAFVVLRLSTGYGSALLYPSLVTEREQLKPETIALIEEIWNKADVKHPELETTDQFFDRLAAADRAWQVENDGNDEYCDLDDNFEACDFMVGPGYEGSIADYAWDGDATMRVFIHDLEAVFKVGSHEYCESGLSVPEDYQAYEIKCDGQTILNIAVPSKGWGLTRKIWAVENFIPILIEGDEYTWIQAMKIVAAAADWQPQEDLHSEAWSRTLETTGELR